jgi:RNA polymerase sigma factor (sigma-70 family)
MRPSSTPTSSIETTVAEAWHIAACSLRRETAERDHSTLAKLYVLAMRDGLNALRTFARIDAAYREDLVQDVFTARWCNVVAAANPRAYFRTAVRNAARSWLRARDRELVVLGEVIVHADDAHAFKLDACRRLASMSERQRNVLVDDALGYSRDEIAARYNLTRANVDQIVSRTRRSFSV